MSMPDVLSPPLAVNIADLTEKAQKSLDAAEKHMNTFKESRGKYRKVGSKYVKALLQPAFHVCTLLDALSSTYPATGLISKPLTAVIKMEANRRHNDARILVLFLQFTSALFTLSQLSPRFESGQELEERLKSEASKISETLEEFGNFSDVYYNRKVIYHLIHSNSDEEKMLEFSMTITRHKAELDSLIGHQISNVVSGIHTAVAATGANVDALIKSFIVEVTDDNDTEAREFLFANGGEEAVQNDPKLLAEFAAKFKKPPTEKLQQSLRESLDDALNDNRDMFDRRFRTTQDDLTATIESSRDIILADKALYAKLYHQEDSEGSLYEDDEWSQEEEEGSQRERSDSAGSQDEDGTDEEVSQYDDGTGEAGSEDGDGTDEVGSEGGDGADEARSEDGDGTDEVGSKGGDRTDEVGSEGGDGIGEVGSEGGNGTDEVGSEDGSESDEDFQGSDEDSDDGWQIESDDDGGFHDDYEGDEDYYE